MNLDEHALLWTQMLGTQPLAVTQRFGSESDNKYCCV